MFLYLTKIRYLLTDAKIRDSHFQDIGHFGIRATIATIFIANGSGKFNPSFTGFLTDIGLPVEMQIPIALAELISGILILVGVLTRISASILSIVMLGAIFYVKRAASLTGQGGYQVDLIILAACLTIIALGPGRISLSHLAKRIPRFLQ